jgi:hypothetical protein
MWFFKGPSLLWIQNFNNFHFLISKKISNHILKHVIDKHKKKIIVVKTCKRKGLGKWFDHFEVVLTYTTQGWVCTIQYSKFSFNFSFVTPHTTLSLLHKSFGQFENFHSKQNSQTHMSKLKFLGSLKHTHTHTHSYTLGCRAFQWQMFSRVTNWGPNSFEPHFWSLYEFDTLFTRIVFLHAQFQAPPLVLTKLGFLCHVWITLQITLLLCFFCCCSWYLDEIWWQKQADPDKHTLTISWENSIKLKIPHVHDLYEGGIIFPSIESYALACSNFSPSRECVREA